MLDRHGHRYSEADATLRDRSFKDGRWMDHVVMSVNRNEFAEARERYLAQTD